MRSEISVAILGCSLGLRVLERIQYLDRAEAALASVPSGQRYLRELAELRVTFEREAALDGLSLPLDEIDHMRRTLGTLRSGENP